MSEREIGLGRLFVQEAVRAGTWGLVFLLVMGMFITTIKQDIKEGIAYGVDRFMHTAVATVTHPALAGEAKRLVKEGIDYSLETAASNFGPALDNVPLVSPSDKKGPALQQTLDGAP